MTQPPTSYRAGDRAAAFDYFFFLRLVLRTVFFAADLVLVFRFFAMLLS
jgi:hypothetical protein